MIVFAFDSTTNLPKTGDAANITAYVSKDYGSVTVLGDTSASEADATNAKGYYLFDLTQGETNADTLLFSAKSSTSNIVVIGVPATVFTEPNNFHAMSIDSNGRVDVIKLAGTTCTARDIGASVLLSTGTGTGQLDFTSGVVKANVTQWLGGTIPAVNVTGVPLVDAKYLLGTIFSTPATAGIIDVNLKNIANATVSTSSAQLGVNVVNVGTVAQTGGDIYPAVTNIGVTSAALNKVADSRTITTGTGEANTYTSTAAADGTYHSISDSAGSIDFYYEATLPTTGGALTGVNWLGYVVGVVNTIKVYIYNWTNSGWDQVGSVVGIAGTVNMDSDFDATNDHTGTGANALKVRLRFSATGLTAATVKTDRLLFGYAVVPNTTTPPTAAAIATQIWTDTTASDFTTALSVGKSLMNGVTLGTGLTVNALTTNNDKTGYSLSVTPPTSAAIATAIWTDLLASSDFSTSSSIGKLLKDDIDAAISSRLATSGYTAPSNLTAAQIATGVWTDTTAGDFTTALSIGKSVLNGVSLGTGLTINAYTGNTVQSGDSFARIGATGSSLTSLAQASLWTSTRAGYVDNLSGGAVALASTALSTAQWTTARSGYLDNINNASLATISTSAIATQITTDHGSGSYQTATGFAVAGNAMTLTSGERNSVADAVLTRDVLNVEASANDHSLCYVVLASSEVSISGTAMTVYRTNGSTVFASKTVTKTSGDQPVRSIS